VSITTPIERAREPEGGFKIKVGEVFSAVVEDERTALLIEDAARRSYNAGRRDQQRETAAILKGVLGL
jgi:hypothetical protein